MHERPEEPINRPAEERVVVGPTPPLTAIEAQSLQRLKQKVRRPDGGIKATPREREVIGLMAVGLTDKEAAGRMRISPRTVQMHTRNFCQRNGVRNRAEATALWTGSHFDLVVRHLTDIITATTEQPAGAAR